MPTESNKMKGNRMNQSIYELAEHGGTIRIAIQKKIDGTYILGASNGKTAPLICQGDRESVDRDFESLLPDYLNRVKQAAIEAKLKAVTESAENPQSDPETESAPASDAEPAVGKQEKEQPELDFGF